MLLEMYLTFAKIGAFAFGGGYAMIPLLQRELLSKGWLSETLFLDVIAISEMTPGPIAINTATFAGYQVAGFMGSVAATAGVVTPSLIIGLLFAKLFLSSDNAVTSKILQGIGLAVVALVFSVAIFLVPAAINSPLSLLICGATLIAIFKYDIHPIIPILAGGIIGIIML